MPIIKENLTQIIIIVQYYFIVKFSMKKIKYLLYKTKKQKYKLENTTTNSRTQYLTTMKNQAIKSLQDFQQDCLNKTQLNITLTTNDTPSSQYRSRSDHKENMRRTFVSNQSSIKTSKLSNKVLFEAPSLNIRKMLRQYFYQQRIKKQVQQKEANKLRNPFYKIQKIREIPKKFSMTDKNDKRQQILINQNKSLCLKQQKQPKEATQNKQDNFFISRDKKQWYFGSRKFRYRTVQQDQTVTGNKKKKQSEKNMPQSLLAQKENEDKKYLFCSHINEKQASGQTQFEDDQFQNFKRSPNIELNEQVQKGDQNEMSSVCNFRQRSLTVKYNEIKDYFERKYNKSNLNDDERDNNDGYCEQKTNQYE